VTVRIAIDLNVRVRENQTYSGFENVRVPGASADDPVDTRDIKPGTAVIAFEEESGIIADATVTAVDEEARLVYLAVDWGSFRDDPEATDDPGCE
jgi:hypothetical protein